MCGALQLASYCVDVYPKLYMQNNSTHKMATTGERLIASIDLDYSSK